jgi:hypothetical protein
LEGRLGVKGVLLPVADAGAGERDIFSTYATAGRHGIPKQLVEVHGPLPATLNKKSVKAAYSATVMKLLPQA